MGRFKCIPWILVFLIFGCAGIQTAKQMNLFDATARAYLRTLRWGDYETAYAFKNPQSTDDKLPDFETLSQIRITAYNVKQTILSEDQTKVLQVVDFQYYRTNDVTVKNLIDQQKWEYDKKAERWYLMSDLPEFK